MALRCLLGRPSIKKSTNKGEAMKDSNLVMKLEIQVSGAQGWQEHMAEALQNIGNLVADKKGRGLLKDKGDASNYTFQYDIKVEK